MTAAPGTLSADVARRVSFDRIRYANCWEDSALLIAALRPGPGRRILSVASAGDNSLQMLASGAQVVAADLSPAQIACTELRLTAVRALDSASALAFLGFQPCRERRDIYRRLRSSLTPDSRRFWDDRATMIEHGPVHGGKFERYLRRFRKRVLPLIHSRQTVAALLEPRPESERVQFYRLRWNNRRWRWLFRLFFSRFVMGRMGRDPEFFRYVEGSVADRILARTEYALTRLDPAVNPYLRYILAGTFAPLAPDWTRPEILDGIRQHADKLTLFTGGIEEAARQHGADGFDGFNLSDVFEYMDADPAQRLYKQLLDRARPQARLAYWNMLVPRACPPVLRDRVRPCTDLAARLFAQDRAFFYRAFHVDEMSATANGRPERGSGEPS